MRLQGGKTHISDTDGTNYLKTTHFFHTSNTSIVLTPYWIMQLWQGIRACVEYIAQVFIQPDE